MLKLGTVGFETIPSHKAKTQKSTSEKISLSISNYPGCPPVMLVFSLISFSLWTATSTFIVLVD